MRAARVRWCGCKSLREEEMGGGGSQGLGETGGGAPRGGDSGEGG
jgi:hypothetical protein